MALVPVLFGAVKTGLSTLLKGATIICNIAPYAVEAIQRFYPTNTALLNSVKAVQAACQVMRLEIIAQRDVDREANKPTFTPSPGEPPAPPEPEPTP